jgi:hypothetical protein
MVFIIYSSEGNSVDPVNIPGDLSVNSRELAAFPAGPGHNSDLLAVGKQGTTSVTLQFKKDQNQV